jgi:2-amino-4-hydroxy-6-hydroxymethyldihydropteridine diphosphokinase
VAEAVLALGSNLGDRLGYLRGAVACLEVAGFKPHRTSSIWETPPYPAGQPRYLNAVIAGETEHSPEDLLASAKQCEAYLGRTPTYRWGPRTVDVDILFYIDSSGPRRVESAELVIPHPRIADRAFVLVPLAEVMTEALPFLDATAAELLTALGDGAEDGIQRWPEPLMRRS